MRRRFAASDVVMSMFPQLGEEACKRAAADLEHDLSDVERATFDQTDFNVKLVATLTAMVHTNATIAPQEDVAPVSLAESNGGADDNDDAGPFADEPSRMPLFDAGDMDALAALRGGHAGALLQSAGMGAAEPILMTLHAAKGLAGPSQRPGLVKALLSDVEVAAGSGMLGLADDIPRAIRHAASLRGIAFPQDAPPTLRDPAAADGMVVVVKRPVARCSVYWDVENCTIPKRHGGRLGAVIAEVRATLVAEGFAAAPDGVNIEAFAGPAPRWRPGDADALRAAGVKIVLARAGDQGVDQELLAAMLRDADRGFSPRDTAFVLWSSDKGFAAGMRQLRQRGFAVGIIHNADTPGHEAALRAVTARLISHRAIMRRVDSLAVMAPPTPLL